VLQQLLDYIELLRKHLEEKSKIKEENQKLRSSRLANSSALIIEADGEGEEISETELDISQLEKKYRIRNGPLFVKSAVVLGMVVLLFFLQPFIPSINLTISWIAILGALLLLVCLPPLALPFRSLTQLADSQRCEGAGTHLGQNRDGHTLLLCWPLRADAVFGGAAPFGLLEGKRVLTAAAAEPGCNALLCPRRCRRHFHLS